MCIYRVENRKAIKRGNGDLQDLGVDEQLQMYISNIGHPGIEFGVVGEQAVATGGRGIKMSETAKKLGSTPPVTLSEFHFGLHARSIAVSLPRAKVLPCTLPTACYFGRKQKGGFVVDCATESEGHSGLQHFRLGI